MRPATWLQGLLRRHGAHGRVWRARDRLVATLDDVPPEQRLAFADVLPTLDSVLERELPRLSEQARFLRSYLSRVEPAEVRREVRHWERQVYAAGEPELRAVRERNLELARAQAERLDRLQAALQRYTDQMEGLALAVDEAASRIASSQIGDDGAVQPELQRLRQDLDSLAVELAELSSQL